MRETCVCVVCLRVVCVRVFVRLCACIYMYVRAQVCALRVQCVSCVSGRGRDRLWSRGTAFKLVAPVSGSLTTQKTNEVF